ncbi:glycosyltransferase family 4 protein [Mycetocola sp. 2940]|uniref:glycosyltransferase family 4 protein n=1 Tax=Mycetocola sp. 2940 TaxID=3156452 RepID=UPI0033943989
MTGHRILLAHPSADLYGSDRVLLESIDALLADQARVTVTMPVPGPLVAEIEKRGATVVICPSPVLRKDIVTPRGLARFLAATVRGVLSGRRLIRTERPSAIYVNTITVPLWLPLARLSGIPSLCHVHEAEGSAGRLVRVALATPLLFATRIIANSEYSVDVLNSAIPRVGARTQVIYNAVPGPDTASEARAELTDGIRLVYVGRLSPRKGVDVAVSALSVLHARGIPASLDVVGSVFPGYEWYEHDLRAQAARVGSVRFHGYQDPVWDHLAEADVAVVPSRYDEPFGNTAVEAMLARRPVIVSATSGLREATSRYQSAQRVLPSSPDAIADAVEQVASNWAEIRAMASEDRDLARDRHSAGRYAAAITGVVHEMIANEDERMFRGKKLSTSIG